MDLLRPLQLAGLPCVTVTPRDSPVRYSRRVEGRIEWADPWDCADELAAALIGFARGCAEPPVLFFEEDRDLLFISRERERLGQHLRFSLADAELVEDLVDKARFARLAERLELPVPRAQLLCPGREPARPDVELRFPIVIKPLNRRNFNRWGELTSWAKALPVETAAQFRKLWPTLVGVNLDLIAQELVPGPETLIESYHVYVDEEGAVAGEFTGRKIRTRPRDFGFSTAVEITQNARLASIGRGLAARLGLRGVAKFDFKRAPDGSFVLLEVNPRFNLWHHPGALAGVNLPALVYADLTGRPRPAAGPLRPGVRWVAHVSDALAAREQGLSLMRWLPWAFSAEAKSTLSWDDPMPFVRGVAWHELQRRIGRRTCV